MTGEHEANWVEATGISKIFGQVRALDEFDIGFGAGVFGLLGPNGSGKSTFLKLCAGQLRPDTGKIRIFGRDPFSSEEAFGELGLCPEQDKFYEDLTGVEFVTALTRLHGFDAREAKERAEATLARVGMERHGRKQLAEMSRGMRQRTKIAQAIAHEPRIVLLDEPLTGADPVARADLIDLVLALGDEDRCVVVSSHVLHEVEAMTHNVVLIRFGRLRAQGDIFRLRELLPDRPYRIEVKVSEPRQLARHLIDLPYIRAVEVGACEDSIELTTTDLDAACAEVPAVAARLGMVIEAFTSPDADLESLYRYLAG